MSCVTYVYFALYVPSALRCLCLTARTDDGNAGRQHNPLGNFRPFVETFEMEIARSPALYPITTMPSAAAERPDRSATLTSPAVAAVPTLDADLLTSGIIPHSVGLEVIQESTAGRDEGYQIGRRALPEGVGNTNKRPEHNFVARSLHRPTFCPVCRKVRVALCVCVHAAACVVSGLLTYVRGVGEDTYIHTHTLSMVSRIERKSPTCLSLFCCSQTLLVGGDSVRQDGARVPGMRSARA